MGLCTARRSNPDILINSEPDLYREWLKGAAEWTDRHLPENQRFVFINAWNEWAEGAYLEPDRRYGYAFLNATAAALNHYERRDAMPLSAKVGIGAHIYYLDLLDEFLSHFEKVPGRFGLYVTTPNSNPDSVERQISSRLGSKLLDLKVVPVENKGRDMGPFVLNFLDNAKQYDICCWVHSKKSTYEPSYGSWREYLLDNLLGTPENVAAIMEEFRSKPDLGLMYPKPFPAIAEKVEWGSNFKLTSSLLARLGIKISIEDRPLFPAGGMFWFRPRALGSLLDLGLTWDDFERLSNGPRDSNSGAVVDGTLSHALERMITYVTMNTGFHSREFLFSPVRKVAT